MARFRTSTALVTAMGIAALGGCSDPKFQEVSAVRAARIGRILTDWEAREQDGPRRLAVADRWIRDNIDDHEQKLARDLAFVRNAYQEEVDRWPMRWHRAQTVIQKGLDGKPDRITPTFQSMFY